MRRLCSALLAAVVVALLCGVVLVALVRLSLQVPLVSDPMQFASWVARVDGRLGPPGHF
jgi:hypothetical protein